MSRRPASTSRRHASTMNRRPDSRAAKAARTTIAVEGARVHNLKNISLEIPRDRLIVVTGLSGSGKSSLAFDTIYAEGQRRYMESLSSYAKRFVAQVTKPDVDFVFGLSPVISIEQKTLTSNPRSTVGTMTDVASYLNLLFATIGEPHCPRTGETTPSRSASQILEAILSLPAGAEIELRAPVFKVYGEDLDFVFTELRKKGCRRVIVDGKSVDIAAQLELDESAVQHMDAVVDRFVVNRKHEKAIKAGVAAALLVGDGLMQVHVLAGASKADADRFYRSISSATHHLVYGEIGPAYFVFNDPESACRTCGGLGVDKLTHPDLLIPDPKRSIRGGCFVKEAFKYNPDTWDGRVMFSLSKGLDFSLDTPWKDSEGEGAAVGALRHRSEEGRADVAARSASKAGRPRGQGSRLQRHCAPHRALLPPLSPARRSQLQDGGVARQGDGRAHVPRLHGGAAAGQPPAVHHRRQDRLRHRAAELRRAAGVSRHRQAVRPRRRRRAPCPEGDPRPPGSAAGNRARLSQLQPPLRHAVWRRVAAHQAVHADRVGADGHALRPRRAEHRPAPERQRQDDRDARESSRHRQHGDRRRARRGHDSRRRSHRGDGARPGRARRYRGRAGQVRGRAQVEGIAHRPVPVRPAVDCDAEAAPTRAAAGR